MEPIDSIVALKERLATARPEDDKTFQFLIVQSMRLLELSDIDLSDIFSVSRPTVQRWKTGENAPHPLMRRSIYSELSRQASAK